MAQVIWIVDECDYEGCWNLGIFDTYRDANEYFGERMKENQDSDERQFAWEIKRQKERAIETGESREAPTREKFFDRCKYTVESDGSKKYRSLAYTINLYPVELGWHRKLAKDVRVEYEETPENE